MNIEFLSKYLKKENISIDEKEFGFQLNSHPDYPSLLAISDTLKFFNVNNIALKISDKEIDKLPTKFVAKLKTDKDEFFSYVEKKENMFNYIESNNKSTLASLDDFKTKWGEIVLLIENEQNQKPTNKKTNFNKALLQLITFAFLVFTILQTSFTQYIFLALSAVGFFLSIISQKELLNTKFDLFDKFCNISANTSCNTVLDSKKWKILKIVGFGDLGIIFFGAQLSSLFLFSLLAASNTYFQIQLLLLILSLPFLGLSVYYQSIVEKKWCPVCISIIAVTVVQLFYVFFSYNFDISMLTVSHIILYGFIFSLICLIWVYLKDILQSKNKFKQSEISLNRFKRSYSTFKLLLTSEKKYSLPESKLVFGNKDANLKISIITSPFCGHCEEPYELLKAIERKYGEQLQISVFYNVINSDDWLVRFVSVLIEKNLKNKNDYYNAMDYWYEVKDGDKWLKHYKIKNEDNDYSEELFSHTKFFIKNNLNFTPCLFINGYEYPKGYKITELPFFIEELIEDYTKKIKTKS